MNCREDEAAIQRRIAMRMNGKALKRCRHGQGGLTLDRFRIPFFGYST